MHRKINGNVFALVKTALNEKGNRMLCCGIKIFCAIACAVGLTIAGEGVYELNGQKVESVGASRKPKAIALRSQEQPRPRQSVSVTPVQDSFLVSLVDSIQWLTVEKNKDYTICVDDPGEGIWKIKQFSFQKNLNNCVRLNSGNFVKSGKIDYVTKMGNAYTFNILVEMKYIDLGEDIHLLGYTNFNEFRRKKEVIYLDVDSEFRNRIFLDSLRVGKMTAVLAVDRYKVTECEFVQTLWDSIPAKFDKNIPDRGQSSWVERKRRMVKGERCAANDSAEIKAFPYWAFVYANLRSLRDGLNPVYSFQKSRKHFCVWNENGGFEIWRLGFQDSSLVHVDVNDSADGYRLPYYDEWMALARGGGSNIKYLWGEENDSLLASQYAWFGVREPDDWFAEFLASGSADSKSWRRYFCGRLQQKSRPVGMLKPNKYGLYDMSGLVCENVMLPGKGNFKNEILSCKGGFLADSLEALFLGAYCDTRDIYSLYFQGLRLVRQIR